MYDGFHVPQVSVWCIPKKLAQHEHRIRSSEESGLGAQDEDQLIQTERKILHTFRTYADDDGLFQSLGSC